MARTFGWTLTASLLLITQAAALAARAEISHTASTSVTIRIWDRAELGSEVWKRARAVAEGVFKPAGIELLWVSCAIDDTSESLACSSPTGTNNISLRIYRRTKPDFRMKSRSRGGSSLLLAPEGGRGIIHVFSDRITEVSQIHKVPLGLVLGITVAHEVGHLLLPHQPHALAGIMRAELNSKDWRLAAQGQLGFTDGQMEMISTGVLARNSKLLCNWLTTSLGFQTPQYFSELLPKAGTHIVPSLVPDPDSLAAGTNLRKFVL